MTNLKKNMLECVVSTIINLQILLNINFISRRLFSRKTRSVYLIRFLIECFCLHLRFNSSVSTAKDLMTGLKYWKYISTLLSQNKCT